MTERTENEVAFLKEFFILYEKLIHEDFVSINGKAESLGTKCVEILDSHITRLDPLHLTMDFGPRKTPSKYVEKELDWYLSEDLNIKGHVDDIEIWTKVCDKDGFINSNYGNLVFSKENFKQYQHVLNELIAHPDSRRALIIYTRPSIWLEYDADGMSDFICTISAQVFIRNNKLYYINNMRSQDAIFGMFSDVEWASYVYRRLFNDLKQHYPDLEVGTMNWNCGSFHLYEKHFQMLKDIIEANKDMYARWKALKVSEYERFKKECEYIGLSIDETNFKTEYDWIIGNDK